MNALGSLLPLLLVTWLKAGIVLGLALAIVKLRGWSAEQRHLILLSAIVAAMLLPLIASVAPKLELPLPAWSATLPTSADAFERPNGATRSPGIDATMTAQTDDDGSGRLLNRSDRAVSEHPQAHAFRPIDVEDALVGIYLIVAALLLGYFVHAAFRINRRVRTLRLVADPAIRELIDTTCRRLGVARRIRIVADRSGHTPWAWGLIEPTVVLPPAFSIWSPEQQRDAVLHELSHLQRFDLLTAFAGCVCAALCWPQPLVWLVLRAGIREAEHACDDRVLLLGASNTAYAAQLLAIANDIYDRGPLVPAMAGRSAVSRRVRSILDSNIRRTTVSKSSIGLVALVTLGVVGTLSAVGMSYAQEAATANPGQPLDSVQNDDELRALVENLTADDRVAEAANAFTAYVSRSAIHDAVCSYCTSLLLTDDTPAHTDALHAALHSAFTALEQQAYATNDGDLLFRIARIAIASTNREWVTKGTWYLFEALRIGNAAKPDAVKMLAIEALAQLNRFEDAKSLAEQLYVDTDSAYYQSDEMRDWIKYFTYKIKFAGAISARLLSIDERRPITQQDYVPIYKAIPRYPETAAKDHKEGSVVVEFTVNTRGRTENVFVVQSSDPVFETAAIEAARQFLYMPQIVNGAAVDRPGVKNKITFTLGPDG